jgi:hypothetical protein
MCAAMGKVGAVIGAYTFLYMAEGISYEFVLGLCSVLSIIGAVISFYFISDADLAKEDEQDSTLHTSLNEPFTKSPLQ